MHVIATVKKNGDFNRPFRYYIKRSHKFVINIGLHFVVFKKHALYLVYMNMKKGLD